MGLRRNSGTVCFLDHCGLRPLRKGQKRTRKVVVRGVLDEIDALADIGTYLVPHLLRCQPHQMSTYILNPDGVDPLGQYCADDLDGLVEEVGRERTVESDDVAGAEEATTRDLAGIDPSAYVHEVTAGPVSVEDRSKSVLERDLRRLCNQFLEAVPVPRDVLQRVNSEQMRVGIHQAGDDVLSPCVDDLSCTPRPKLIAPGDRLYSGSFDPDRFAFNWALCRSEERRVGKECRSRWSPY